MTQLEDQGDGPLAAVAALFRAIVDRDIEAVVDHYEQGDALTVFVEGPRWLTVGHDAVARGWRAFDAAPVSMDTVEVVDGPYVVEEGSLAVVATIVELTTRAAPDAAPRVQRMRMTHVLRQAEDGAWRTVHEHASQPLGDPYGSGDWLPSTPSDA